MKQTKGSIEGGHLLLTGPVRAVITLEDGTDVDVTPAVIDVSHLTQDQIDEIDHRICMIHFENGHPDDREIDLEEGSPTYGQLVQRPFAYQPKERFKEHLKGKKAFGTPHRKPGRAPRNSGPLASTTAENQALNALDASGTPTNLMAYVSLHTASPSTTGANEYAGVTRQACTWNAASGGTKTNSTSLSFTTSGATAVTHVGTFSAVTAGTYGIGAALSSSVTAVTITVAGGAITLSAA